MADLLVRTTLANVNGVAADGVTNDFSFSGAATAAALTTSVIAFFNTGHANPALADILSPFLSRTANVSSADVYDLSGHLDGSPHGSPILHTAFTLGAAGAGAAYVMMPSQIAAVLALHATFGSTLEHGPVATRPTPESAQDFGAPATHSAKTRPKSTLRGRLYIGPLVTKALNGSGIFDIGGLMYATLKDASNALLTAQPTWSVWSRSTSSMHPIVGGWLDEQPGVRRTRRLKTSAKLAWP